MKIKRYVFNSTGMEEHPQGSFMLVGELRELLEKGNTLERMAFEEWWATNKFDLEKVYSTTLKSKDLIGLAFLAGMDKKREELLAELQDPFTAVKASTEKCSDSRQVDKTTSSFVAKTKRQPACPKKEGAFAPKKVK